ncbi:hypothetical protein [Promicromonospora umidemergens]|uniref:hypothetical protein n=1 Tax=Promicromonospora umidemergens TaxID=629679 RepID=UPI0020A39E6C|nr:hypothetical protein [Promicromonospora umidemergens]
MNDDELVASMMRVLEIDFQVVQHFAEDDTESVAQFRRCGRRAIRNLGYKARTHQTDPDLREDRLIVVHAMIANRSDDDDKRLEERAILLVQSMPSPFDRRSDP